MRIELATPDDLLAIRAAYEHGRDTQRSEGSSVWPEFGDDAILREIAAGQLWRVADGEAIAGVFTAIDDDPAIWRELERGAHLYLHRIARAPEWPGRGLMDIILAWAADRCRALNRDGVRIDTWADNTALIAFYARRGFRFVGRREIGVDPRLPPHYHGNALALMEQACESHTER